MKIYRYFMPLIMALFASNLFAQEISINAQTSFGGQDDEFMSIMRKTADGYVLFVSSSSNPSGNRTVPSFASRRHLDITTAHLDSITGVAVYDTVAGNTGFDVWVIKLDEDYNITAQTSYGWGQYTETTDAAVDVQGSIYFTIRMYKKNFTSITGESNVTEADTSGVLYMVKMDNELNEIWQKRLSDYDEYIDGIGMITLGNGNIVLLGEEKEYSHYNAILQCVNSDGDLLWRKDFSSISSESILGSSIKYSSIDDAIYMLINSNAMSNSYKSEDAINGTMDYWFAKVNPTDGTVIWDKTIGTNEDERYYSEYGDPACFVETESFLYVAMTTKGGISGTRTCERKGYEDMLVTKLDKSGNIILDKSIGNDMYTLTRCIIELPDNRLAYGTVSDGNVAYDKTEPCKGGNDLWFIITDYDVNVLTDKTIGTSYGDWGTGMNMCLSHSDNNIVVATSTPINDIDNNTIWYGGVSDIWLFEISSQTDYIEFSIDAPTVVYPNPVSDVLYLKNLSGEQVNYSIFNVLGQEVANGSSCGTISVADLEKGVYFLQVEGENSRESVKFVVE